MAKIIQMADSNGNVYPETHTRSVVATKNASISVTRSSFNVCGNALYVSFNIYVDNSLAAGAALFTLPATISATTDQDCLIADTNGNAVYGYITGNTVNARYAMNVGRYACNATFVLD